MPPEADKFIDTLQLSTNDRKRLISEINKGNRPVAQGMERRRPRFDFTPSAIAILIVQPGGGKYKYSVTPRNISTGGLAFVHGRFVHVGSVCICALKTLSGKAILVYGKVVRCRHLQGLVHEVSVAFDDEVSVEDFVELTPDERRRLQDYEALHGGQNTSVTSVHGPACSSGGSIPPVDRRSTRGSALVVDSTPGDRSAITPWLRDVGLKFTDAGNDKQALAMIQNQKFLVAIVNCKKCSSEGLDVVRRLRKAGFSAPIVAIDVDKDPQQEAAALEAGANACLSKPLESKSFNTAVANLTSDDMMAA
ncbi:MAG: response regulator [Phycisphaera sp.]|nr:response regulator [Phycisphaera sp.]